MSQRHATDQPDAWTLARLFAEPAPLPSIAGLDFYPWVVVGTVCIGAFMGQLDASIAQLVLPNLQLVFKEPLNNVEWVAIAYLLTLAALLAPVGRLADIVGRKVLYTGGFVVFIIGSGLCGASPTLPILIGARVLQAVGAAFLQANSVAIVTAAAGPDRRGRAIGIQATFQALGLSVGPALGGLLISVLGWRWVFFINVPAGIIGASVAWFVLPRTVGLSQDPPSFDLAGAAMLGCVLTAALLFLSEGASWGWLSPATFICLGVALGLGILFITHERAISTPVLDLGLFTSRSFTVGNITGLLAYGVTFGVFLLVPYGLERAHHDTPLTAGLILTAIPLAIALVAPASGSWSDRVGPRPATVSGMLLATLALVALALVLNAGPTWPVVVALLVLGAGLGLFTPSNNSAIMGAAPLARLGAASGVLNMMRSLGTSLGVAVSGAVLAIAIDVYAGGAVTTLTASPADVAFGLTIAFAVLAVFSLLSCVLSLERGTRVTAPRLDIPLD